MAVWGSWVGSKLPKLPSLEDDFDEEPVNNSRFSYGVFQLVGHGEVANEFCGKYLRFKGCLRVDLHNLITLDGKSYKGKVFTRKVHHFVINLRVLSASEAGGL